MKEQQMLEIILSEQELLDVSSKNRDLLLNLTRIVLNNHKQGSYSSVRFEDELGVTNEGIIFSNNDTSTVIKMESTSQERELRRIIDISFRGKLSKDFDSNSANVKDFSIKYKDKDGYLAGQNIVHYCPDGKTVSYCKYWHYDHLTSEMNKGIFEKKYEKVFIQGVLERRVAEHAAELSDKKTVELSK